MARDSIGSELLALALLCASMAEANTRNVKTMLMVIGRDLADIKAALDEIDGNARNALKVAEYLERDVNNRIEKEIFESSRLNDF